MSFLIPQSSSSRRISLKLAILSLLRDGFRNGMCLLELHVRPRLLDAHLVDWSHETDLDRLQLFLC